MKNEWNGKELFAEVSDLVHSRILPPPAA